MSASQDVNQPNLRLPIELMVNIIEESLDLRRRSRAGRRDDPPRRYPSTSTQENAVGSLIRSCKLFASIIIPKLYRDVLLRKQYSIEVFLDWTRFSSLGYIKTLYVDFFAVKDLYNRVHWYKGRLPELVELRRMQIHFNTPRELAAQYPNIDGSVAFTEEGGILEYKADWEFLHRPRLEHLEVNGDIASHLLPNLLKFFTTERLVINGFHFGESRSALPYPYLAQTDAAIFQLGGDVTLHCDMNFDYFEEIFGTHPELKPKSLTLTLGWWQNGAADTSIKAKGPVYNLVSRFIYAISDRATITIKPYLSVTSPNLHAYCFAEAIDPVVTRKGYPDVYFPFECDCGHGKETGFWDGVRQDLVDYFEMRYDMGDPIAG